GGQDAGPGQFDGVLVGEQPPGFLHDLLDGASVEVEVAAQVQHVGQARVAVLAQPVLDLEGLADERIVDEEVRRPVRGLAHDVEADEIRAAGLRPSASHLCFNAEPSTALGGVWILGRPPRVAGPATPPEPASSTSRWVCQVPARRRSSSVRARSWIIISPSAIWLCRSARMKPRIRTVGASTMSEVTFWWNVYTAS